MELTDRFCQSARPGGTAQTDYFDTLVTGLSLRVSASTKTFYVHYSRPRDGVRARMKLGRYPDLRLAKAREKAKLARQTIAEGADPLEQKRVQAASQTVAEMVENYVLRHASTKRSGKEIARRLRRNLSDTIGDVKVGDLHRRDITKAVDIMIDRGATVEANRLFQDARAMVRWARGRGDLDSNLMEGMRLPTKPVERDRVLSVAEIKTVWATLQTAQMWEETRRILRLCLITLQRVGEVSGMTIAECDLEGRIWTIPSERSKNGHQHQVHLSEFALEIIQAQIRDNEKLARRKKRQVSSFIFPGPGARAAVGGAAIAKAVKKAVREDDEGNLQIMGVPPWTPHDLRRTAATHTEELGFSPFIIGHVLNHASVTRATITTRVYARYTYAKEKQEALDAWAAMLRSILS